MSQSRVRMIFDSFVLLIAAQFVATHYRREHCREQLLRELERDPRTGNRRRDESS
jgi:hypothetical protein